MAYLGNYVEDYATLNMKFTSRTTAGVPFALASGAISVYKANGTTQSTAGITLSADFDSVTGLNNVLIDLSSDAFYAVANDYQIVITTGTVNSVSVVGEVVGEFSIENRFVEADVTAWLGTTVATPTVGGVPEVDVTHQGGGAVPAPAVTGVPDVNMTHHVDVAASVTNSELDVNVGQIIGTAPSLSGGDIDVNVAAEDDIDFGNTKKASINTAVDTAWTTQMADSVPAVGTIPTREQSQYMALQILSWFSISGTTISVKKPDGTELITYTLDDGTNPTSRTRAT